MVSFEPGCPHVGQLPVYYLKLFMFWDQCELVGISGLSVDLPVLYSLDPLFFDIGVELEWLDL